MAKRVVDVLVPVALDRAYSYRVPETLSLAPGDIVSVPLGARDATYGVIPGSNQTKAQGISSSGTHGPISRSKH